MTRFICFIAAAMLVSPALAETPTSVADLVKQLGDPKFTVREAAQKELLKRGEGIVPELQKLAKTTDPESADRIGKVLYALVGYKADILRLLADVQEGKDSAAVPVSDELRGLIAGYQPGSGDLLVSILAQPEHSLYRRALRAFVATWDAATSDQIDRYVQQVVTLKSNHHRAKFPAKVGAMISFEAQIRDGWTGWPPIGGDKKFEFRTRTTRYVDGKPYDKPFQYQYPFATVGWVKVGELAEGKHTIHATLQYEFTQHGQKRKGEIRSKDSTIEVLPADTPDDLVARPSKAIAKSVRDALSFLNYVGEDIKLDPRPGMLSPREDIAWQPQVSWYTDKEGNRAGVHCPVWQRKQELDVDLCFDVSIRETKTGTVHPSDPIVIPKGAAKSGGWGYVAPRDPRAFAKGRDGFVAVKIHLKPSRAQALTDPRVTSYFPDEIESGELKMKVIPKIEPIKGR